MKYLIPVLVGGAAISAAITTALAQAHGAFTGHVSLTPYLYGYGAAFVLLIVAALLAMQASRQERSSSSPPLPPVQMQTVIHENKPEIHIENKPVFENKPTIVVSTGAVPTPAPESERAYREVLAFLERTMQNGRAVMYFVENIATATHLPEQQVFNALERLVKEEHVFRRPIEGVGSDGGSTRWGYIYWYAHF